MIIFIFKRHKLLAILYLRYVWVLSLVLWLQDHMRKAGDVCFAEVSRDSEGMFLYYVAIA